MPAGSFDSCLLIEQVTAEAAEQNALSEAQRQRDWQEYCGTRQAWYAPGVGLVQLHVQSSDGAEALLQLQAFSMPSAGQSQDYLPLSAGSAWTYGWANVPEGLAARDVYHVVAKQGDHVFVAHYGYVCREGSATG